MRELEVMESVSLEDGKQTGTIDRVEERTDPFEYTDVYIKESKTGFQLKLGCPTRISIKDSEPKSKLASLLSKFVDLKAGLMLDPAKVLVGKEVEFMTLTKKNKDGKEFVEIVEGSIKPLVKNEEVK